MTGVRVRRWPVHQNPGRRIRSPWTSIIAVCLLAMAAVATACARPASQHPAVLQASAGQHPAVPQASASWHPALPRASCGVADFLGPFISEYPSAALGCFSAAARLCKAASIGATVSYVDTGTDYVFTIEPGGAPCAVMELSQDYSANFGGSTGPVISTPCRVTAVTGRGVDLDCGGQDVLIPAAGRAPPRVPARVVPIPGPRTAAPAPTPRRTAAPSPAARSA